MKVVPRPPPPLWLLALITLGGTLAMHIFVPALPAAAEAFDVSAGAAQQVLSCYIVGLAVGQLLYGPVSDYFGRRNVLLVGTFVYLVASICAIFAHTVQILVIARVFQALGACAGFVLGRAIARDDCTEAEAARRLSLMNLMTIAGPMLAPLMGGVLVEFAGWRSIFVMLSLIGLVSLVLVHRLLHEGSDRSSPDVRVVARNYMGLLRSRVFVGYAIGGGCATTSLYAYIAASPFIFIDQLHRPVFEVGIYLGINLAGAWLGSLFSSRAVARLTVRQVLILGNLVSCTAALVFLSAMMSGYISIASVVVPMLFYSFGSGMVSAPSLAAALGVDPKAAGSASGLYGFMQMLVGSFCTMLVGFGGEPAVSAGMIMLGCSVLAQFFFRMKAR